MSQVSLDGLDDYRLRAKIEETELELRRQFLELCQWITSLEVSCQGQQQHNSDATKEEETAPLEEQLWEPEDYEIPPHCIPIRCDVREAPWDRLTQLVDNFDAIMMDPPWQLATANPTRGVALGYNQLSDECIASLPIHKLQKNGFMFIWVINAKYRTALHLFQRWGYRLVDDISWVKYTVNRRFAKNHGFYLQHAKETCLVGFKGALPSNFRGNMVCDVICSERRGQSQKPDEIYEIIEQMIPNGRYLEIFARKNNLRNYWVSIGNEVVGEMLEEIQNHKEI
ncbi:hypothetical protein GAYE_SCF42G5553 [Galdieria yellowstonensis]|uniref:mRNA m(6)A methyltransferase n=1 Tax=Galdieria yellowstonensis TaxID=3028027 RepID=A0AAV9IJX0_9RHOD|nr:hypothetical protein GAYE_SCF42G5553 [Galdieria yellowstonensis]